VKVLVTGASGFIGANVVRALLAAGHQVRAFVRRPDAPALAGLDIELARRDLGLRGTDLDAAIRKEIDWFRARGYL
jgi:uncharacterized protein YbjT (DUF2867 family)